MDTLQEELTRHISGEVRFDEVTRRAYSVDASIYEVVPLGVVTPRNKAELIATMEIAKKHAVPVIARGAATGITGGCLGRGIIVDLSKYLRAIIEINYDQEYAVCEPGVIQDELNDRLSPHGYRLGPDTSTGNRATIGGMLANNAAGARSLRYGKMVDHVEEVTLALSGGELIELKRLSKSELLKKASMPTREGLIYQTLIDLKQEYAEEIAARFPKIPRRVSGYNLDELIKEEEFNPAKLIAGSEGTLGIAVEIKLKICKKPKFTALCVMHCDALLPAMQHIPAMLAYHPLSLEMIDAKIISAGRSHPALRGKLDWLKETPEAVYIAEFEGEDISSALQKLNAFTQAMQQLDIAYAYIEMTDPAEMKAVWELRKAGLGLLLSKRTYSRAIAFIEDVTVAPEKLFSFMTDFLDCLKSFGKEAGIYGHVGSGCLHVRPYIDLGQIDEQQTMQKMMQAVADLLLQHGGALSGEHGDGYIRSWLNEKMFGKKLYSAFCKLKYAFDPENLLNPEKIVHAPPLLHDLRSAGEEKSKSLKTFLNFTKEGGLKLAADLCNGNGMCRKQENVMCPSFQVTHDEYDTTRARAQTLRAIIHGHWPTSGHSLADQGLHEVLDLCIQCKGCRTECPSQVDMAKMKSEALYHYHRENSLSFRTYLFGKIGRLNQLISPAANLANRFNNSKLGKWMLSALGITNKRSMPRLTTKRFSRHFPLQPKREKAGNTKSVVLFNDTFTEFNHPEIGLAAVKILECLGYSVIVPPWNCCGRTFYSKGMLEEARKAALKLISQLASYARQGIPIIGLEPSCVSMLTEDFEGLVGEDPNFIKIQAVAISFDAFLHRHLVRGKWPLELTGDLSHFLFHGHCHQKAHEGTQFSMEVLQSLPGCQATLIDAGCCGMAGAFGYETEHYAFSMQIGNLKLFPAIKNAPASILVANGTSCRQQIFDGTGRHAFHIAEVIAARIK